MNFKRIFESSSLKEDFNADYAAYQDAKANNIRAHDRQFNSLESSLKIARKRWSFEINGSQFYLKPRNGRIALTKIDKDGNGYTELDSFYPEVNDRNLKDFYVRIWNSLNKGQASLKDCTTVEEVDEVISAIELYKDVITKAEPVFNKIVSDFNSGMVDGISKAITNRKAIARDTSEKEWSAREKARNSLADETPDFEEGGYAVWHSKNGLRKVTIVSIDEPNERAKINTSKGATMYVPLSTLTNYVDFDSKGLADAYDAID